VFPLKPGRKRPRPGLTAWEAKATTDAERIVRWWGAHPSDNVAIATGPAALAVVDLDVARPGEPQPAEWPTAAGGADVLGALAAEHGEPVPTTWTVATPSGGRHLYYRAPKAGGPWRNTAGRIGWHIDTRAEGGYVVAAGSVVDGKPYVVVDDATPAELPLWIARLLRPPASLPPTAPPPTQGRRGGYAAAALRGELQRVLDARPGQRNAALNRAAWNLARHIATGLLDRPVVEAALWEAGLAVGGQTSAGVRATVRSAIDARLARAVHAGAETGPREGANR
jgi:hypothetical protein